MNIWEVGWGMTSNQYHLSLVRRPLIPLIVERLADAVCALTRHRFEATLMYNPLTTWAVNKRTDQVTIELTHEQAHDIYPEWVEEHDARLREWEWKDD